MQNNTTTKPLNQNRMTAKEKANRLCIDFLMDIDTDDCDFGMNKEMAKQCALVAVNEILESFIITIPKHQTEFWEQVKQEIINL